MCGNTEKYVAWHPSMLWNALSTNKYLKPHTKYFSMEGSRTKMKMSVIVGILNIPYVKRFLFLLLLFYLSYLSAGEK